MPKRNGTEHCNHSTPQHASPQSGETETKLRRKTEACRSGKATETLTRETSTLISARTAGIVGGSSKGVDFSGAFLVRC